MPNKLYHGLTIDGFLSHWEKGVISPSAANTKNLYDMVFGTWLFEDYNWVFENGIGVEKAAYLGTAPHGVMKDDEYVEERVPIDLYKTRTIVELSGVPDAESLKPNMPHRRDGIHFYLGDIPMDFVEMIYLDQEKGEEQRVKDLRRLENAGVPREKIKFHNEFISPL